jgi:ribose transport system ATP-binding protein
MIGDDHQMPVDGGGAAATAPSSPLMELRGIVKEYGAVRALRGVDFDVRAGEIHGLLGGNGAGKSTLMKCLAGAEQPSAGTMVVDGEPVAFGSAADGIAAGIGVVYQELSLFGSLTIAENLLGARGTGRFVNWAAMRRQAREHLAAIGLNVDPDLRIEQLTVGEQQMVEMARALFSGARLIVLDEPTSALSAIEKETLFRFVAEMSGRGVAFVLVTHSLEDVLEHSDRITVLRDGRAVADVRTAQTTRDALVRALVGRDADQLGHVLSSSVALPPPATGPVLMRARDLRRAPAVRCASFEVHEGEVLALYGHLGSGHTEIADLLFGLARPDDGAVEVGAANIRITSPTQARGLGVGYISIDRREGLALEQPIADNMTLASLHRLQRVWLRGRAEDRIVSSMIDRLRIAGAMPAKPAGQLSGGNQQKVLFARWLVGQRPDVLVLVEPTRGMDVGAKAAVMDIVGQLASEGTAVVVISSEPETVMAVAHRILVTKRGAIAAELVDTDVTEELLMEVAS